MWNKKIPIKDPSGMFNKTDFFDFLGEEFFSENLFLWHHVFNIWNYPSHRFPASALNNYQYCKYQTFRVKMVHLGALDRISYRLGHNSLKN